MYDVFYKKNALLHADWLLPLQGGVVGETAHFTVCAKHGHAKELSVSIEGPAQANIKIHDNKVGRDISNFSQWCC